MPKMGDGMEEGTLVEWLKSEGDKVKTGDVIGTIQTDKATLELESPGSGILAGLLIQAGATVPVGKPIAALVKEGEILPEGWGSGALKAAEPAHGQEVPSTNGEPQRDETSPAPTGDRIKASPLARKVAKERGVDLSTVVGSGPGGRIVEKDVTADASRSVAQVASASAAASVVALNRLRQITAQRTAQSKREVPHFYVTVEVDVEEIQELRELFDREGSGKVSVNDFVVKASARALQDMPEVNATFQGDSVLRHGAVHVGMAVAVPDGLTVPVIKNAHALTLRQIAEESKRLAQKARDNKLTPDELSGSTFSISNMGMLKVDDFVAIINQPNAAILAVSTAKRRAVVVDDDRIVARMRMNVTLSFDHRVVDGAVGARFANVIRDYLQNPTRLLS